MNYIYDIYINLQNTPYDFYDWNEEDDILHIKKIPAFKISTIDFKNIKNNIVKIDKKILDKIYHKTEQFKKNEKEKISNIALFSNGIDAVAIKFNKNRINKLKSCLTIDDNKEVIDIINKQKETKINYKIIKKQKQPFFKTRLEKENEIFINKELNIIYNSKNYKKINYICLECFGKTEKNLNKAIKKIKKEIIKGNDNLYKIFNTFKTT